MHKGIAILGMHRSGTSLVAETVHNWGASCCTDQLIKKNWWNPKGHWEYKPLVEFNNSLLRAVGGSWAIPPSTDKEPILRSLSVDENYAGPARALLSTSQSYGEPWFWKDPRLCLLTPFWKTVWNKVAYVVCIRNPVEVALSLRERNGIPLAIGAILWQRYMLSILRACDLEQPSLMISYHGLIQDPAGQCERLASFLAELCFDGMQERAPQTTLKMTETVDRELDRANRYRRAGDSLVLSDSQERLWRWTQEQSSLPRVIPSLETEACELPTKWRDRILECVPTFKGAQE